MDLTMRKDFKTGILLGAAVSFAVAVGISIFSDNVVISRQKQLLRTDAMDTPAAAAHKIAQPAPARYHMVQPNENLMIISKTYYGTSENWKKILQANAHQIQNPEQIRPGMKLVIP